MAHQDVNRFFDLDNSYKNCGHCRFWMGAIVFTASSATCPAFSIIPVVWADIQEDRTLYHRLDMDLRRNAVSAW